MTDDELFDQQMHDAFERIQLDGDAQERMLANLLAARDAGEARDSSAEAPRHMRLVDDEAAHEDGGTAASTTRKDARTQGGAGAAEAGRKRSRLARLLPLAAVLVLAVVIVQVSGIARKDAAPSASAAGAAEETAPEASKETDAIDALEMEEVDALAAGAADESADAADLGAVEESATMDRELCAVDYNPSILLEDGSRFTALRDGLYVEEVDAARVGDLVGRGTATPFDASGGDAGVACDVFELVDGQGAYAVRYEGETTYWLCTPIP